LNNEPLQNECSDCLSGKLHQLVVSGCRLFMNQNFVYRITDIFVKSETCVEIHAKYITPIPNILHYNNIDDIVFVVSNTNINEFIFFEKNECVVDVFGNIYYDGIFIENLLIMFDKQDIYSFNQNVINYIYDKIRNETDKVIMIWSPWNCLGFFEQTNEKGEV
jgi:hypothetical protein